MSEPELRQRRYVATLTQNELTQLLAAEGLAFAALARNWGGTPFLVGSARGSIETMGELKELLTGGTPAQVELSGSLLDRVQVGLDSALRHLRSGEWAFDVDPAVNERLAEQIAAARVLVDTDP